MPTFKVFVDISLWCVCVYVRVYLWHNGDLDLKQHRNWGTHSINGDTNYKCILCVPKYKLVSEGHMFVSVCV